MKTEKIENLLKDQSTRTPEERVMSMYKLVQGHCLGLIKLSGRLLTDIIDDGSNVKEDVLAMTTRNILQINMFHKTVEELITYFPESDQANNAIEEEQDTYAINSVANALMGLIDTGLAGNGWLYDALLKQVDNNGNTDYAALCTTLLYLFKGQTRSIAFIQQELQKL